MKSNSIALLCRIEKLDKRIMCITVCIVSISCGNRITTASRNDTFYTSDSAQCKQLFQYNMHIMWIYLCILNKSFLCIMSREHRSFC